MLVWEHCEKQTSHPFSRFTSGSESFEAWYGMVSGELIVWSFQEDATQTSPVKPRTVLEKHEGLPQGPSGMLMGVAARYWLWACVMTVSELNRKAEASKARTAHDKKSTDIVTAHAPSIPVRMARTKGEHDRHILLFGEAFSELPYEKLPDGPETLREIATSAIASLAVAADNLNGPDDIARIVNALRAACGELGAKLLATKSQSTTSAYVPKVHWQSSSQISTCGTIRRNTDTKYTKIETDITCRACISILARDSRLKEKI